MTMTKFTMLEIATLAGVSKATVSRALNKPHLVNEDTRQKILKIMKEHKYVYNVNAADFSRKKAFNYWPNYSNDKKLNSCGSPSMGPA